MADCSVQDGLAQDMPLLGGNRCGVAGQVLPFNRLNALGVDCLTLPAQFPTDWKIKDLEDPDMSVDDGLGCIKTDNALCGCGDGGEFKHIGTDPYNDRLDAFTSNNNYQTSWILIA